MQLKKLRALRRLRIGGSLAAAAASLLAGGHAKAQEADQSADADAAVLYYREQGRVQAIEPQLNISLQTDDYDKLTLGFTADTLSGASPIGAVPSTLPQTFVRPYAVVPLGTPVTLTSASGRSRIVIVPPATGATTQILGSSTDVPANTLPLDHGFHDQRYAGRLSWERSLSSTWKLDFGGAYSHEHDYRSESLNASATRDFDSHNTTLNAGFNYEWDRSFPAIGTPTPLTLMSADWVGSGASSREMDAVLGLTQVMSRRWLMSLSYSLGQSHGYLTDPYKLISVVDPVSGQPVSQLYEGRPDSRRKQSLYLDNRIHLPQDIIDLSLRAYKDDWGVKSLTADTRYHYVLGSNMYLEPHVRFYEQNSADFFHYFLTSDITVPQYASADLRLAKLHALTYGVKFGMALDDDAEWNVRVEYYDQQGNGSPAGAIGQLQQQNLFPSLKAVTVLLGFRYSFPGP